MKKPAVNSDPLHELLRVKAREIIMKAVEIELEVFLEDFREMRLPDECLAKDREELLTFYSFPAEHWQHIRTL